jgi:hypothetical protein
LFYGIGKDMEDGLSLILDTVPVFTGQNEKIYELSSRLQTKI